MKNILPILAFAYLFTIACTKEPSTPSMSAVTGTATHISCRNAEISGKANLPSTTTTDLSFGVLYSTSSGVLINTATNIVAKTVDSGYNYTISTEVLESDTTYYYRSYIIQNKEIFYGEVKSFRTLAVNSMIQTLDATEINPKDAVLNATLNLTDCKYNTLEYGFEVTPEGGQAHTDKSTNLNQNKFSLKKETLARDTRYSFVAYVNLDGRTYKGEVKNFTTTSIQASITAESSNIEYTTATISGQLTIKSDGSFSKSADLYLSRTDTTVESLKANGKIQIISLNSDGSYSVEASRLRSNSNNHFCVVAKVDDEEFVTSVKNFTTKLPANAVDLGLSVLWHQCNLGATKPEEYGTYFAWGDVIGQTWNGSTWSGGGFSTDSPYEVDSNNNLTPKYDAAHVNLSGTWRMPTKSEQQELIDSCTVLWTSNYNATGVAGRIFTSKKAGYTDKSIFLPAAGIGNLNSIGDTSTYGYYWSSTNDGNRAWSTRFDTSVISPSLIYHYRGMPVRPVSE